SVFRWARDLCVEFACSPSVHKNPNSTLSYQSLTKMDGSLHLVPGRLKAVLEEGQSGMGKCRSQNHGDLRPTCVCVCVCVCVCPVSPPYMHVCVPVCRVCH